MHEADASSITDDRDRSIDRRALLRRLAATSAVAWAAPEILATKRASAAPLSGCYTDYDFDDGTLQGWTVSSGGGARWQVSSLHSFSGGFSAWFGRAGSSNSLHPVPGEPSYQRRSRRVRSTLTSPETTAAASDIVCFEVRLAIESSPQFDTFRLFIVQESNRAQLWDKSQGGFAVIDHPEDPGSSYDLYTTQGSWSHIEVAVGTPPGIDLQEPVRFEFDFQSVDDNLNRTEGVYLDNILLPCGSSPPGPVSAAPALSAPAAITSSYSPPPDVPPPAEGRQPPTDRRAEE